MVKTLLLLTLIFAGCSTHPPAPVSHQQFLADIALMAHVRNDWYPSPSLNAQDFNRALSNLQRDVASGIAK